MSADERVDAVALAERVTRLERRLARERAARRESERIAEESLRRMYEANELKTVLLSTVNHELRTPAAIIGGFAEQLITHWDEIADVERRDAVDRIRRNAVALAALIEQVLELARLERGTIEGREAELELRAWLVDLADHAFDPGHRFAVVGEPVVVRVHEVALRQVVVNLVGNAQRYAPADSTVTLAVERTNAHVALSVADEGPGIPPEERMRVFEPFFRGRGDHVTRTSGFGIGLSLVQRLVALHGGDVVVLESPAGGADFRVRLPLDRVVG